VKAIELAEGDEVVGLARTEPERQFVLAVCERGYGKRTVLEEFRVQNRGGKGIILIECSDRNGPVVGIAMVKPEDEVMLITDRGQTIRTPVEGIRETGRNTQGVKLMSIAEDERLVAIEPIGEGAGPGLDEEGGEAGPESVPPPSGAAPSGDAPVMGSDASAAEPEAEPEGDGDGGEQS
jgi:DNA gyrase subunit A